MQTDLNCLKQIDHNLLISDAYKAMVVDLVHTTILKVEPGIWLKECQDNPDDSMDYTASELDAFLTSLKLK